MDELKPSDVQALLAGESPPEMIDCREAWELHKARIQGSTWMAMSKLADGSIGPGESRPAIIFCHHGVRSLSMVRWLKMAMGWTEVWSLAGGVEAWAEDIDPSIGRY